MWIHMTPLSLPLASDYNQNGMELLLYALVGNAIDVHRTVLHV